MQYPKSKRDPILAFAAVPSEESIGWRFFVQIVISCGEPQPEVEYFEAGGAGLLDFEVKGGRGEQPRGVDRKDI